MDNGTSDTFWDMRHVEIKSPPISSSTSHIFNSRFLNNHNAKEKPNMSLCAFAAYNECIYLVADSQISTELYIKTTINNKDEYNPSGLYVATSYSFRKIFKVNDKVFGYSTGDNFLFGKCVTDYVHSIGHIDNADVFEASEKILNDMNEKCRDDLPPYAQDSDQARHHYNTTFVICGYINERLKVYRIAKKEHEPGYYTMEILMKDTPTPGDATWHSDGANWATPMFKVLRLPDYESAPDRLESFFNKIFELSPQIDNTVGGKVHILKITPDNKASWIKNGYIL